jgi:hypothetical protein
VFEGLPLSARIHTRSARRVPWKGTSFGAASFRAGGQKKWPRQGIQQVGAKWLTVRSYVSGTRLAVVNGPLSKVHY